jgi:hypothetical protein
MDSHAWQAAAVPLWSSAVSERSTALHRSALPSAPYQSEVVMDFEGRKLREALKELGARGEPLYLTIIGSAAPLVAKVAYLGEDFIAVEATPPFRTIVPIAALSGVSYDPDVGKIDAWFKEKFVSKGSVKVDDTEKAWADRLVASGKLLPGTAPGTYRRP